MLGRLRGSGEPEVRKMLLLFPATFTATCARTFATRSLAFGAAGRPLLAAFIWFRGPGAHQRQFRFLLGFRFLSALVGRPGGDAASRHTPCQLGLHVFIIVVRHGGCVLVAGGKDLQGLGIFVGPGLGILVSDGAEPATAATAIRRRPSSSYESQAKANLQT